MRFLKDERDAADGREAAGVARRRRLDGYRWLGSDRRLGSELDVAAGGVGRQRLICH